MSKYVDMARTLFSAHGTSALPVGGEKKITVDFDKMDIWGYSGILLHMKYTTI